MPFDLNFSPGVLLGLALAGYVIGAVGALAMWNGPREAGWWSFGWALAAATCGLVAAISALMGGKGGSVWSGSFQVSLLMFPMTLRLDALGAFFVLVVSLPGGGGVPLFAGLRAGI